MESEYYDDEPYLKCDNCGQTKHETFMKICHECAVWICNECLDDHFVDCGDSYLGEEEL